MTSGVRLRPAEQVLVSRARDFLAAGPSDAVDLIAHICQLPGPPRPVADHMAMALLAPWEEFARGSDGRWRLVPAGDRELADLPGVSQNAPPAPVVPVARRTPRTATQPAPPTVADRAPDRAAGRVAGRVAAQGRDR